ncbi:unnamed protein product [Tuber melanosporum]|uniref:(Perigord truffle) hypothetical protein n=1 Tax=Tuber melanosporum (strain Mel28) TaxID=656061 RepID=D5GB54_TUBMM|nr:uncharacterized protein GSTUM_00005457001 [Tuber melanosporum]CAZ81747.1 unnamed protein product [Tuber melanosporum]
MSASHLTASAPSPVSITNTSPSSFTLPSNTRSIPLAHPPHQQPPSPTSSPSTSSPKHSPYHPQGARDSSRRSKSETPSPQRSVAEIPSIQTQSPPNPHQSHNHRGNRTSNSPITNQFLMLSGERPPSPLTLTSALAPPSVMPMTASGISANASVAKSTSSSRRSPAASLTLSMLPSASGSMVQPPTSAAATAATSSQMSTTSAYIHHHQAYAHSLSAQHKLQLHQKEIISQATRAAGIPPHLLSTGPMSPRLIPLGSPGPVTPLTLEDNPGGFFASHAGALEHQQLNQQLTMVASGGAMQS